MSNRERTPVSVERANAETAAVGRRKSRADIRT